MQGLLGVVVPDRGDRVLFMEQFYRMLGRQTLQPDVVEVVDYVPVSEECDITPRYRFGYEKLRGVDVIAFMENDDWYAPNYLETMVGAWREAGCPDLFGPGYTVYYHIGLMRHFTFEHPKRSSMMSTLIRGGLDLSWPADDYPYTDSHLWINVANKKTFRPKEFICLGIKHGIGKQGGRWHDTTNQRDMRMYKECKLDLRKIVGEQDYEFYSTILSLTGCTG